MCFFGLSPFFLSTNSVYTGGNVAKTRFYQCLRSGKKTKEKWKSIIWKAKLMEFCSKLHKFIRVSPVPWELKKFQYL